MRKLILRAADTADAWETFVVGVFKDYMQRRY